MSDAELMAALGIQAPAPTRARSNVPRGIRNNNPGNIEDGAFAQSLPGYAGSDGRFAVFESAEAGAQAAPRLLQSYVSRGFNTPNKIINRWAPPSDNNPTADYAQYVAQRVGIGPDDVVTEDQIPLIAQAISEFENGNHVATPAESDLSNLSDEDLIAALEDDPVDNVLPGSSRESAIDLAALSDETVPLLRKGAWVKNGEEVYALPTDAYFGNPDSSSERVGRNAYIDRPDAGDRALGFATAFSEQIPFGDELVAAGAGALSGRGYDAIREQQMIDREILNDTNRGDRNLGGIAGFAAGLAAPGAGYVARGATLANRAARAGQLGAGYGALYGAGNTDGDLEERAQSAALGAGTGFATGAVAQRALDPIARAARQADSPARQLSREGISLTPGQMAGGVVNTLEEVGQSIPILREAIQGARVRGLEDFNRAVANRALRPLGETVDSSLSGRELVSDVYQRISNRYTQALSGVQVAPDPTFRADLGRILSNARLSPQAVSDVDSVLSNTLDAQFTGVIDGTTFKALDEEIGAAARAARNSATAGPTGRYTANVLEQVQDAMDDLLERIDPAAAAGKKAADEAYANFIRLQRAGASTEAGRRAGVFTAPQFNSAVRASETGTRNARYARGEALMQDLSDAAVQVLPPTVPDSGTPLRGLLTGGAVTGGGVALGVEPVTAGLVAGGVGAAAAAYSRPVQAALNAIYRATDSRGRFAGLAQLRAQAAQNPALQPLYADAVRFVQGGAQSQSPSQPQASGLQPVPTVP